MSVAHLYVAVDSVRWEPFPGFWYMNCPTSAELAELLENDFVSIERFGELRSGHGPSDEELSSALRFIYLSWFSFGGKGENFAWPKAERVCKEAHPVKRSLALVREILSDTALRLRDVLVDRRDFAECIQRYDSPATFFYCDPPYTAFSKIGRYEQMPEERHRELISLLSRVQGKFLVSYDDSELVRNLVREHGFRSRRVTLSYTLNNRSPKTVTELLISNFDLSRMASRKERRV